MLLIAVSLVGCGNKEEAGDDTAANPLDAALLTEGKIIFGTSPDYPPYESLDSQGNLEGFDIEMVKYVVDILNKQQGTNYVPEFKQMDFSTIVSALSATQIDIGVSCFTYSPERDCIFSTPYLTSKQIIVTREDTGITCAEDLVGKKVAAGTGTTGAEALVEIIGEENVLCPGDYTIMYQALQAGQLDAVVSDEAVGLNYVKEMGLIQCEEPLVLEETSLIIKTGNTTLADAVNKAIEEFLTTSDYTALKDKWGL